MKNVRITGVLAGVSTISKYYIFAPQQKLGHGKLHLDSSVELRSTSMLVLLISLHIVLNPCTLRSSFFVNNMAHEALPECRYVL